LVHDLVERFNLKRTRKKILFVKGSGNEGLVEVIFHLDNPALSFAYIYLAAVL